MLTASALDLRGILHHFKRDWTPQAGKDLVEYVYLRKLYSLGQFPINYQYINERIEKVAFYSPRHTLPMLELYFKVTTWDVVAYRYTYMSGKEAHTDFSPISNVDLPFVRGIRKLDSLFINASKQKNRCILLLLVGIALMMFDRYLWPYFMIGSLFFFGYFLLQRIRMVYIRLKL